MAIVINSLTLGPWPAPQSRRAGRLVCVSSSGRHPNPVRRAAPSDHWAVPLPRGAI